MADKLFFFSGSKHCAPGKGRNEHVSAPERYADLCKIQDWRKMLSNFHVCRIEYDGLTYNSAEHAFQAAKIRLADEDEAYKFALESGSELSKADGKAAQKMRKVVILGAYDLIRWNGMSQEVMARIHEAKFSTGELKQVLLATNDAQLLHGAPRTPMVRWQHLESLRDRLRCLRCPEPTHVAKRRKM